MKRLLLAGVLSLWVYGAAAVEIGVTAQEVYSRVQQNDAKLLFVDDRDPVQIMLVGFTDALHANVPCLLVDRSTWDDQRCTYKIAQNPNFVADIRAELNKRSLNVNTEIVTMCRSGSERCKPSVNFLRAVGFPNARSLIDGFQGSAIKEGPQNGGRTRDYRGPRR